MFRVNQQPTQPKTLAKTLAQILSPLNSEVAVVPVKANHDRAQSQAMEVTFAYSKRRRRAGRLASAGYTTLRSTWY